ncbi:MAG: hypothetical protein GEU90_05145 [Gemmatimonas sp.]|nr:hypothetical protein [Gemmatimonas sp.]
MRFIPGLARWREGKRTVALAASGLERARAFAKGAICGILATTATIVFAAPRGTDAHVQLEFERQGALLRESTHRASQAIQVADVCLATATSLERTLAAYQAFLGGGKGTDDARLPVAD